MNIIKGIFGKLSCTCSFGARVEDIEQVYHNETHSSPACVLLFPDVLLSNLRKCVEVCSLSKFG